MCNTRLGITVRFTRVAAIVSSHGGVRRLIRGPSARLNSDAQQLELPSCRTRCLSRYLCSLVGQLLDAKMGHNDVWNSHPKNYGQGSRHCRVCGNGHAIIRKYGLNICRQCFREKAADIGFVKYK